MLWAIIAVTGLGMLLGVRFRVNALIAASLALAVLSCAVTLNGQQPLLTTLALTYAFVAALQVGYLVGLALACAWSRFATTSSRT